ncbi:hypothetical protein BU15DRAFT_48660 [Melanogaster broomeanus]|nr:hypothetical protein BU15DRAFT_48660 [Melanogaster broomeanus]
MLSLLSQKVTPPDIGGLCTSPILPRIQPQHVPRILRTRVDELFSCFPTEAPVYFTHGGALPSNILVDGSRITAIIDWETAGFYPEFWEHCRMHDPGCRTPGWTRVLARIFPSPRRERVIDDLHYNMCSVDAV